MKHTRKPMKMGLDYIRDKNWEPRVFDYAQAFVYLEKIRRKLPERKYFYTIIADIGYYYRASFAGQPQKNI